MTVIQSGMTLVDMPAGWWPHATGGGSIQLYDSYNYDYATIYKRQPNVRTCVEFLARNLAQLGLHVYRRVSETDRVRERDHPLARLLSQPLPPSSKMTHYRLIEHLVSDMGIYFNAYWLKLRTRGEVTRLLRVPPIYMEVKGGLVPTAYEMTLGGELHRFAPDEVVHFRGYNSESPIAGLSPLETLRRVLAEEHAAADYREHFWQNAARMGGIIERPKEAPDWSDAARERFKAEFKALYTGSENSGETAVLEEGMQWKQVTFNAQESEYLAGRKLTREECARAYHIPLPMVGILDHATFCLPAHVRVFTEEGPRPIAQVKAGDRVWSHDGEQVGLQKVTRSGQTGVDPILKIKTQDRTLEANATHPILVRRLVKVPGSADPDADAKRRAGQSRWHYEAKHVYVPAAEIRRGDILVTLTELPEGTPQQSVARMEFYGLLLGDGDVYPDKGSVSIARANDATYMDHYREIMVTEFSSFGRRGNGTTRLGLATEPVKLIEGERQTRFVSVVVTEELAALGLCGTAHTKRVPPWVFRATRQERLAFLRGYLDADGSVDKRGKISFSSCSPDLIEDIRHLCMSVGVPVNNAYHRVGETTLPTGAIGHVDQWTITCSDAKANRMIGSHDPRYQKRLASGKGWGPKAKEYPYARGKRSSPPAGCGYSRVVDVEHLPAEPIYDIEVEGTHNFIAAGVVVHNSNIKDQHKSLYQDTLAPWCMMIQEDIDLQLKPDFADSAALYLEFNLKEKLRGSFEEQAQSYQSAVGAPWMTRNEARARENLPSMGPEGDALVTPLNVLTGGMASPRDAAPKGIEGGNDAARAGPAVPLLGDGRKADDDATPDADLAHLWRHRRHVARWQELLERYFGRQAKAILTRIQAELLSVESAWDDEDRWNRELADDLLPLYTLTAEAWAAWVAERYGIETPASDQRMQPWLRERARIAAESINATTRQQVGTALLAGTTAGLAVSEIREKVAHVFEVAQSARAAEAATAGVTGAANFGATEAAKAGGLRTKTWRVNSNNPRDTHAALNGVTVGLYDRFPNNALWPGDPTLPVDERANCQCSVVFGT